MSSCVPFSSLRTLPLPHTHKIMLVFRTTQADLDVSARIVTVTLTPVCLLETGQSAHDNYCPDEMSASPPYRGGFVCFLRSAPRFILMNPKTKRAAWTQMDALKWGREPHIILLPPPIQLPLLLLTQHPSSPPPPSPP